MGTGITKQTRRELLDALRERYVNASKIEKTKILDEFIDIVGCHRLNNAGGGEQGTINSVAAFAVSIRAVIMQFQRGRRARRRSQAHIEVNARRRSSDGYFKESGCGAIGGN